MFPSLLDDVPRAQLKLHTPPDSDSLAAYRRRLRVEWAAYQTELAKVQTDRERQDAKRAYLDAIAAETIAYRVLA